MKLKIPTTIKIALVLLIISIVASVTKNTYTTFTDFYNKSINYQQEYDAIVENQITTFDNNWLAFEEKFSIANINKEIFLQVTNIIMSARTDGQQLAWKWCQENQQIPYGEFTSFYKDLSNFTQNRYSENNSFERQKQQIVRNQNTMLKTFPGVIYNHFLKIKPLIYKKGFITKETKKLFE